MKNLLIVFVITCIGGISFFIYKDYIYSYYDFEKVIIEKSHYPNGPMWHNDSLYYVENSKDRVMRWDGKVNKVFWHQKGCGPTSMINVSKDEILVTCYKSDEVIRLSQSGKKKKVYKDKELLGPNGICSDGNDGFYITTSGKVDKNAPAAGKIFHYKNKFVKKAGNLDYGSGILFIKNKSLLLVNEYNGSKVTSFIVKKDGTLDKRKVFLDLKKIYDASDVKNAGPVGIKRGPQARIYISYFGASRIIVANSYGDILNPVKVKAKYVTNCAFNKKGDKMFITALHNFDKKNYDGKVYQFKK